MKDIGRVTKPMAEVDSSMRMVTSMMATGKTIELMDTANTPTLMVLNTRDTGLTTSNTVKERSTGQMVPNTKETTNLGKRTDMVNSFGLTNHPTLVTLWTIIFMGMESIDGLTVVNTQATGSAIRCTEMVFSPGLTEESTKVNISMTKNRVMVFSLGLTEDNMMDTG